jgi:type II secretory pathway pseudopilin PulG
MEKEKGITLVEIAVSLVIITMFSAILISNFPRIKASFSVTRAAYKLAQDLRRAQDLGLSGTQIKGSSDGSSIKVQGYGIHMSINLDGYEYTGNNEYWIYANSCLNQGLYYIAPWVLCTTGDYIVEKIKFDDVDVYIKNFNDIVGGGDTKNGWMDINFSPPSPTTTINNKCSTCNSINITLSNHSFPDQIKRVVVNTSGLIEVK